MDVAPGIMSVGQTKGGFVHAYLVEVGRSLTLIDTLFDADAHVILNQLRRRGRAVSDIDSIVLSHGHRSHLGGVALLKRLSGAKVYSHQWEADIISGDRKAQAVSLRPMRPLLAYPFQAGLGLGLGRHGPARWTSCWRTEIVWGLCRYCIPPATRRDISPSSGLSDGP